MSADLNENTRPLPWKLNWRVNIIIESRQRDNVGARANFSIIANVAFDSSTDPEEGRGDCSESRGRRGRNEIERGKKRDSKRERERKRRRESSESDGNIGPDRAHTCACRSLESTQYVNSR